MVSSQGTSSATPLSEPLARARHGMLCSRSEGSATSGGTRRRSSKLYPSACRAYPCEREKASARWQLGTSSSNVDLTL
jgi:hypothetical protein